MEREDTIIKYYLGNKAMFTYLMGIIYNIPEYKECILDREYLIGATLGTISNVLLLIKEDIVEKDNSSGKIDYFSKVLLHELEKSVKYIASEKDGKYQIGNKTFENASLVVAYIRNVMAHGLYKIDFLHNRIVVKDDCGDVYLNIDRLAYFIVSGSLNRLEDVVGNEKVRFKIFNDRVLSDRKASFKNAKDLENTVKNFTSFKFEIRRKNGEDIPQDVMRLFEEVFVECNSRDKLGLLVKFKKLYGNEYDMKWDVKKIDPRIAHEVAIEMFPLLPDEEYSKQVFIVGSRVNEIINPEVGEYLEISSNVTNLKLLRAIWRYNSIDMDVIRKDFDSGVICDHHNLAVSMMGMFNSLFLYGLDNIYKNDNIYKEGDNTGLDFSKIDLSKIKVSKLSLDQNEINMVVDRLKSVTKSIKDIDDKLDIRQENLNKVIASGKEEASKKIRTSMQELNEKKMEFGKMFIDLSSEYIRLQEYYLDNNDYLYNLAVITGIRNTIAHGNYQIVNKGNDFLDTEIVFDDIYEGKNTFHAIVTLRDLADILNESSKVIDEFLDHNKKSKRCAN